MVTYVLVKPKPKTAPVSSVSYFGAPLTETFKDNLNEATFDATTDQVTQISLKFMDPSLAFLATGQFVPFVPVQYDAYSLEVATVQVADQSGNEQVEIDCRPRSIRALKNRRGRRVMKHVSPSTFVQRECAAVKVPCVVQPSQKRKQVARDTKKNAGGDGRANTGDLDVFPSTWTTFSRLASEIGFACFEAAGIVYFGKLTWLLQKAISGGHVAKVYWRYDNEAYWSINFPQCQKTSETAGANITAQVPIARLPEFRIGWAVDFRGVPGFNGTYLCTGITFDMLNPVYAEITFQTPSDPIIKKKKHKKGKKQKPSSSKGSHPAGRSNNRTSQDFAAKAMKQAKSRSISGAASDRNAATAFDASELISWSADQADVYLPSGADNQINYCIKKGYGIPVSQALRTRGAILWMPGRVGMSLGTGRVIEAVGNGYGTTDRSSGWQKAAKVPGMRY